MGLNLADTYRSARAQVLVDAVDSGATPGIMEFYTAPKPAKGEAITTQTKLGTLTLSKPCATVLVGQTTFDVVADDSSTDADGEAAWVRVSSGDGTFIMDMTVTDIGGAGPVKMSKTMVYQGGILHVVSIILTEGNV